MHKTFFVDCDGTLLQKDGSITQEDIDAIKLLLDKNHEVILTSGRPQYFLKELREKIDKRIKTISFNGAMVEDKVLAYLDEALVRKLLEIETESIIFKGIDRYYAPSQEIPQGFRYSKGYPLRPIEEMNSKEVIKCLIYKWHGFIQLDGVSLYQYEDKGYEILPYCTSKGLAVERYLEKYKSKPQTISIGDDVNDISMFNITDVAYLMKDAPLELENINKCASVADAIMNELKKEGEIKNETY